MKRFATPAGPRGFSLVVSLIILTLLAVLVVSFLSTTALDRTTARAFFGKSQAEVAASTGVNQAVGLLADYITRYPDSVTFWEALPAPSSTATGGTLPVEGTMLYFYEQPPPTSDVPFVAPTRRVLPLMSRGVDTNGQLLGAVPVAQKKDVMKSGDWSETRKVTRGSGASGRVITDDTAVNLNQARFNGDNVGWIGSPLPELGASGQPANVLSSPRPYRAKWIDLKENGNPNGRTVGRYAFWIEDESFKLDLNQLGSPLGGRGSEWTEQAQLKTTAADLAARPLPLQLAALGPLQGFVRSLRAPADLNRDDATRDKTAIALATFRDQFLGKRVPDQRSFNQAGLIAGGNVYRLADEAKFLTTTFSSSLNLSRQGGQRLNLNGLGFEKRFDDLSVPEAEIQKGIDRLVSTIRYHAPKFSQRFYRTSTAPSPAVVNSETMVVAGHRDRYLYKLAANIRDYMDPDFQPTIILDPGVIRPRNKPLLALPETEGPNPSEVWAQGKDSAPFLQEAVARYRSRASASRWELWVDYYMEFWNMTNRDISAADLGPNPVLRITNQMGWISNGGGGRPLLATASSPGGQGSPVDTDPDRAVVVDLLNNLNPTTGAVIRDPVVFRAGACTVITTDPDFGTRTVGTTSPAFSGGLNTANVYYRAKHVGPRSNRYYTGAISSGATGIKPVFRNGGEDYVTEVVLANDQGFLEFHASPIAHGGGVKTTTTSGSDSNRDDWYGGSLLGNATTLSQLSDPRTNNEAIVYTRFISGASTSEPDQARYWNTVSQPRFSLGHPNVGGGTTRYSAPHLPNPWPDYYRGWNASPFDTGENPTARTAPAFVFNGLLTDADGQLVKRADGTAITPAGTVMPLPSIGMLGDVFDPARVQGSVGTLRVEGARGGGRTLRIGQRDDRLDAASANPASRQWASWRLVDFLSVTDQVQLPGLININGLLRDCVWDEASGSYKRDAKGRFIGAGAALRAAAYGMRVRSVSRGATAATNTATVADTLLASDEVAPGAAVPPGFNNVIDQATKRMTQSDPVLDPGGSKPNFGPFSERGEISELELFSIGTDLLSGVNMAEAFDRTREEVGRRMIDLITTRGNVFTAYAVGQSIKESPDRTQRTITGTHRLKVTFQLVPKREDNSDFRVSAETFDPKKTTGTAADSLPIRFAKPHHYDIRILQVSS